MRNAFMHTQVLGVERKRSHITPRIPPLPRFAPIMDKLRFTSYLYFDCIVRQIKFGYNNACFSPRPPPVLTPLLPPDRIYIWKPTKIRAASTKWRPRPAGLFKDFSMMRINLSTLFLLCLPFFVDIAVVVVVVVVRWRRRRLLVRTPRHFIYFRRASLSHGNQFPTLAYVCEPLVLFFFSLLFHCSCVRSSLSAHTHTHTATMMPMLMSAFGPFAGSGFLFRLFLLFFLYFQFFFRSYLLCVSYVT